MSTSHDCTAQRGMRGMPGLQELRQQPRELHPSLPAGRNDRNSPAVPARLAFPGMAFADCPTHCSSTPYLAGTFHT